MKEWRTGQPVRHFAMSDYTKDYETITVEDKGKVTWLTLNRPDELNTITPRLTAELYDFFGRQYDDNVKGRPRSQVIVMRAEGKHFSAGLDLSPQGGGGGSDGKAAIADNLRGQRHIAEIIIRMRRSPQPIIALVQGAASGGGMAFALAADVLIMADDARMNVAMARIGMTGNDIGLSYFITRALPSSVGNELMMTGRFLTADRAYQLGVASEIHPRDKLDEAGAVMAQDMLRLPPLGSRLTKEGANIARDAASLEAVVAMEDRQQILMLRSGDMAEGVAAFMEKRLPDYQSN